MNQPMMKRAAYYVTYLVTGKQSTFDSAYAVHCFLMGKRCGNYLVLRTLASGYSNRAFDLADFDARNENLTDHLESELSVEEYAEELASIHDWAQSQEAAELEFRSTCDREEFLS